MTLGLADPRERVGGGEANGKTKVGPCWRSFIQSELGREEWNKTPGIRPSLPPFTKYIDALII